MAKLWQGTIVALFAVLCVTAALTASAAESHLEPLVVEETNESHFPDEMRESRLPDDGRREHNGSESPAVTLDEDLRSLYSLRNEQLTLDQVALKLPSNKTDPRDAMIDTMEGINACMKYVTLPRRYVSLDVNTTDEVNWSLFRLELSTKKEEALRDLATAVAQIVDLFHISCPASLSKRKKVKKVLPYAEQLLRVAVHKAMLRALATDPNLLGGDESLVPGLFVAAEDVRKNPRRLGALERLLGSKRLYEQRKERLASVLESSVTSDLIFLQNLNLVRSVDTALAKLRDEVSLRRSPVLGLIMRNKYPRIHSLVEEATSLAFEGLMKIPLPSIEDDGTSPPGSQIGVLRANETLPCLIMDGGKIGLFNRTIFVWKYREMQKIRDVKASEWSSFLARLNPELGESDTNLAKKIEMVRPLCYKKLKSAPFPRDEMAIVSTAPLKEFKKLLEKYDALNGKRSGTSYEYNYSSDTDTSDVLPEEATDFMARASRRGAVAVPKSWATELTKAGILKFLKNVGLAVLAVGAIGIGFFLTVCAAGFISGGVGSLVSCAAGAAIAGTTAMFLVSPGISMGVVGLVGIGSTLLWKSRVHLAMMLAVHHAKQTFKSQKFTDLEARLLPSLEGSEYSDTTGFARRTQDDQN